MPGWGNETLPHRHRLLGQCQLLFLLVQILHPWESISFPWFHLIIGVILMADVVGHINSVRVVFVSDGLENSTRDDNHNHREKPYENHFYLPPFPV